MKFVNYISEMEIPLNRHLPWIYWVLNKLDDGLHKL